MGSRGYYIFNIDISDVVLAQMREKVSQEYFLMDATNISFPDRTFDLVLDKGTFDALAVSFM